MPKWPVISPEFDLRVFCYQIMDKDPLEVSQAASTEINYALHNHRAQTKQTNFRKNSKGRQYCDDLQKLIHMLMDGKLPSNADQKFIEAVAPLIKNLLLKWRIGTLHEHFKN